MCTFSAHSLIKDPPFSTLDLISCRNLLIYLGPDLQKKLVPLFHFGLRPGGFLLLGPSEDLAAHSELFTTIDKKHRLFRRSEVVARPPLELPLASRTVPSGSPHPPPLEPERPRQELMLSHAFERMIRNEYAPPCVVVNERGEVLYLGGKTSRYLQPREGPLTHNLLDQAPTSLRVELRAALSIAIKTHDNVVRENVHVEVDGSVRPLRLTVRPLPGLLPESGLYAVIMQEAVWTEGHAPEEHPLAREALIIEQLEDELRGTRDDLQSAMESLETSNEELKSANEELTSTNEELQSANEELQSSREELQTINDELREKVHALDVAHSELQNHYAGSQIATIFLDRELRIARFTPAATVLFQLLKSDVGRSFSQLVWRFGDQRLMAEAAEVLRTGVAIERRLQTVDGNRWFLIRLLPYLAPEQVVTGIGITCIDITDLHRAEEAERHYGRLSDAIFVWRLANGIETWNRGAEELYGFTVQEVQGQVAHDVLKTKLPRPWKEIEETLRGSGRWEGEMEHQTKDGQTVTVSAKLALTRGEDGVERVLESDRDISDRRRTEEAQRDADRHRSAFLALLSHELRNPLAPIRNSLHVLQQATPGGDEARRALSIADRQVGLLAHLVDDLLDVTRITRNKVLLRRKRLELNELVRRTVEDHHSVLEASDLHTEAKYDPKPVFVDADPNRIAQVLGNLLQNAAKFTPRGGGVSVSVSTETDASRAVVRVTDTGIGMEPGTLASLFQPFMQAESTPGRSKGGLGLGLALVKGLVELHGGTVTAASAGLGLGADFILSLPLAPTQAGVPQPDSVDSGPSSRRVLIIEDNVDAADSLRMALVLEGHEVAVAYNGPDGLAMAIRFHPEILLCDVGMHGMDGYEVAGAFCSNPLLQGTYLVAMTGNGRPDDIQRTAEAGFDLHLTKPPTIEQFRQAIAGAPRSSAAPRASGLGDSDPSPPPGISDRD